MKKTEKLLFIGDSITESGRFEDSEGIGFGYVRLIRDFLQVTFPDQTPVIINRGISGNHITDLVTRWDRDVIEADPDYLSISIGINDVWRRLDHPEKDLVYPDQYEEIYRSLIEEVQSKTKAAIILMEPSIHGEDVRSRGNEMLVPYAETVQKLACEYKAILVPAHQAFIEYLNHHGPANLTTDGVHMTSAGNMLLAKTWVRAFLSNEVNNRLECRRF
ncbi:SGNH/GDSL hydrolase family protein [Peribacillus deserti]|uniref:Hydrolase n=1 Tax=Peribacillus deserti TaxID=673318 RepID=A0A2N5M372_9BACI|nr:SGNH/GDSL hydrolase family protein [Peribacillus deserti]PLT28807.1 hydrolase [Peribacillus deserti]